MGIEDDPLPPEQVPWWRRRWPVRLMVGAALVAVGAVAAVVVVTEVVPRLRLAREYEGSGVRWSVPAAGVTDVRLRVGDNLVVAGEEHLRLVSLADGHSVAELNYGRSPEARYRVNDRFQLAAGDLLASTPSGGSYMYQRFSPDGTAWWRAPIVAEFAAAASGGLTVLGDERGVVTTLTAYDRSGTPVWTREGAWLGPWLGKDYSIEDSPWLNTGTTRAVLPAAVVVQGNGPVGARPTWEVLDVATGTTRMTRTADEVGVLGDRVVTVDQAAPQRCTVTTFSVVDQGAARTFDVSCTSSGAVAAGDFLFLRDGRRTRRVDMRTAESVDMSEIELDGENYGQARGSGAGRAYLVESEVQGGLYTPSKLLWHYPVTEPALGIDVSDQSLVLFSRPSAGHGDIEDRRITVLDLDTGRRTGQVRTHERSVSVLPVGTGAAIVVADDRLILLGHA